MIPVTYQDGFVSGMNFAISFESVHMAEMGIFIPVTEMESSDAVIQANKPGRIFIFISSTNL